MFSLVVPRRAASAALGVLFCSLLAAGCQKKDAAPAGAPETAAASASPGGNACEAFVSKLCATSGESSALCGSGKSLGGVLPETACQAALRDYAQVEAQVGIERKPCNDLVERLCKDLGPETETCGIVREQTPQFPREQCEQLSQSYAQVLAELKQREAQNQPLAPEVSARIAGTGAPGFGPEDAKVTIVEFSDFQCPFCSRAANVVHQVREKYGDKVRFVFRQFPLPSHAQAHLAAQAALEANKQGKFWEYHDLLFANQRALSREALESYAKQVNLNMSEFRRALDAQTQKAAVDADLSLGDEVSVNGTPTVFINGKRVPNPTDFELVAKLIDEALGA